MAAEPIKKEDVSTDNIYEYDFDYETGEFSGYWLKFKYVEVPMDRKDPFNPVQNDNAYPVYDCYLFDTDDISAISETYVVDYYYVDKDTYDILVNREDKLLEEYLIMPYEVTNGIMTVNKFYIPADFNIEDWIVPIFGTLNITQDANQNISAELQTDTDWTGKDVYAVLDGRDDYVLYLKLKADSEDPTKLVFDDEYEEMIYDDTYLDENTTGTCELQVQEGQNEDAYTIDYSWTNEYVEPEEQVDTIYVTPRLLDSEAANINNLNIGYQLSSNSSINSPIINTVEFTGHAEQGLTLDAGSEYIMGVPFGYKFENNTETEYYSMSYCPQADGDPKIMIVLSDGDESSISLYYTISSELFPDFNIEEDHTYTMTLYEDPTDVQSTGILHVVPRLKIDDNLLSPDNSALLDFDISQGTTAFVNWITNFQEHIYLFGCIGDSTSGEFSVADVPFEISNVTVYYTADGDISQLSPGQTEGTWSLNAISIDTLSDGTNEYTLEPMSVPEETQEDPAV